MRTTNVLATAVSLLLAFACTSQKEVVVGSDAKPDTDFDKFATYYWATSAADNANLKYTLNNVNLKSELRDAIKYELDARGYRLDESDPDLLVNFRVLEEDATFTGYSNPEQYSGYWSTSIDDGVLTEEGKREYDLKKGTVLIDFLDADEGVLVWQGYASGLVDVNMADSENIEKEVKDAVQIIFTEWEHRAGDATASDRY